MCVRPVLLVLLGLVPVALDPDINEIPDDIMVCYMDRSLWDRYHRLPASIDSLVSIIRKIELDKRVLSWTPGRLASTLLRRFRFDGIIYDPCLDTSSGALPFRSDLHVEFPKMALLWRLISGDRDEFPEDSLTQLEKCSLHWMLSYSVNTTFRDDEYFWDWEDNNYFSTLRPPYQPWPPPGHNNKCQDHIPRSRSPWEMGVVWSPSGPLAAGTVLAGLTAGLRPQTVSWSGLRVENGHAASLSGDLAQTALMKRKDEPYIGPDGHFNSTVCPMAFYMRMTNPKSTFSKLTVSEINAGLDGLLLATFAHDWERKSEFTLSQIIDLYYSTHGISVQGSTPILSACDRYSNYFKLIDAGKLVEQAFNFGYEMKTVLVLPFDDAALRNAIAAAKVKLDEHISILDQALNDFGPCADQRRRDGFNVHGDIKDADRNLIDKEHGSSGIASTGIILDTSIFAYEDVTYMQQVTASLVNELDIWATATRSGSGYELMPGGSIVQITDGRFGNVLFTSEYNFDGSDEVAVPGNKAELACEITRGEIPLTGDLDLGLTLEKAASRMNAITDEAEEVDDDDTRTLRAQAIVVFVFSRLQTRSERNKLNDAIFRTRRQFPHTRILFVTRWASANEFADFVTDPERDVFVLDQYDEELRAERDGRKIAERIAQLPASITYSECRDRDNPEFAERRSTQRLYIMANTQRFLQVLPKYFHKVKRLEISFGVEFNSAEICWSRASPEELSAGRLFFIDKSGRVDHKSRRKINQKEEEEYLKEECRSASINDDVTFEFVKPCGGKSLTRCRPIYFRVVGVDAGGIRCKTKDHLPCRTANSALITVSHRGMKCGAMGGALISWTVVISCFLICFFLLPKTMCFL